MDINYSCYIDNASNEAQIFSKQPSDEFVDLCESYIHQNSATDDFLESEPSIKKEASYEQNPFDLSNIDKIEEKLFTSLRQSSYDLSDKDIEYNSKQGQEQCLNPLLLDNFDESEDIRDQNVVVDIVLVNGSDQSRMSEKCSFVVQNQNQNNAIQFSFLMNQSQLLKFVDRNCFSIFYKNEDKLDKIDIFSSSFSLQDLKFKQQLEFVIESIQFEEEEQSQQQQKGKKGKRVSQDKCIKREKERQISEVLDYVQKYRDLFKNGIFNQQIKSYQRLTLQQCASIVGISKKTLDDYHQVIQKAQGLGFDFGAHVDDKFGVVRRFVKQQKK